MACRYDGGLELAERTGGQAAASVGRWRGPQARGEKVHVVVHEDVRVQLAAGGEQCLAPELPLAAAVIVIEEAGQASVAALHDVLRNAGEVDAGLARHRRKSVAATADGHGRMPPRLVG